MGIRRTNRHLERAQKFQNQVMAALLLGLQLSQEARKKESEMNEYEKKFLRTETSRNNFTPEKICFSEQYAEYYQKSHGFDSVHEWRKNQSVFFKEAIINDLHDYFLEVENLWQDILDKEYAFNSDAEQEAIGDAVFSVFTLGMSMIKSTAVKERNVKGYMIQFKKDFNSLAAKIKRNRVRVERWCDSYRQSGNAPSHFAVDVYDSGAIYSEIEELPIRFNTIGLIDIHKIVIEEDAGKKMKVIVAHENHCKGLRGLIPFGLEDDRRPWPYS